MARRIEVIGTQFGFEVIPETGQVVPMERPVEIIRHTGKRPLLVSPSKLELFAQFFENPEMKVPDPREIPIPAHLKITTGSIVHSAGQAIRIWDGLLPADPKGHRAQYYRNLELLAREAETTSPAQLRTIYAILADDRLALPGTHAEFNQKARGGCAAIITEKVLAEARKQEPFVETPNFPELENVAGLPFPDPEKFTREWDRTDGDQGVITAANRLFSWRENNIIADPARMAARQKHPTLAATELRVSAPIFPSPSGQPIRWTERMDAVERTRSPNGVRHITVSDVKTGAVRFPRENQPWQKAAQRAVMFLTAMTAVSLPVFEPNGKTIELAGLKPRPIGEDEADIRIIYLSLASDPARPVDFAGYYGADWRDGERFYGAVKSLENLLAAIVSQAERLEPLLR